jgi:hypothetical protein
MVPRNFLAVFGGGMNALDVERYYGKEKDKKKTRTPNLGKSGTRSKRHKENKISAVVFGQAFIEKKDGIMATVRVALNNVIDDCGNDRSNNGCDKDDNPKYWMMFGCCIHEPWVLFRSALWIPSTYGARSESDFGSDEDNAPDDVRRVSNASGHDSADSQHGQRAYHLLPQSHTRGIDVNRFHTSS